MRSKKASMKLGFDYFIRLSILEGAAGVTAGTWTRSGAGLTLARNFKKAQVELPMADPEWFSEELSVYYKIMDVETRGLLAKFPNWQNKQQYVEDAQMEFLASPRLRKIGLVKAEDIAEGMPPKSKISAYFRQICAFFMMKFHRAYMARQMKNTADPSMEIGASEDPITEALSDPDSPAGKVLYDWMEDNIKKVPYRSKSEGNWNGPEIFRTYLKNLREVGERGALKMSVENDNGDLVVVPPSTVKFIAKYYVEALTRAAASDRRLSTTLSALFAEGDYKRQTRSVYDQYENAEDNARMASAYAMSNALLAYAGGESKLEQVFDGQVVKDAQGFSLLLPDTETRYGDTNMVRIWSEGPNRVKMGLYHSTPRKGLDTLKVLNLVTADTIPTGIANAFQIPYRVNLKNLPELPTLRMAKKKG